MSPLPNQPVQPPKKSGFLRTFFIVVALILLGILIGVLASKYLPIPTTTITPVATPTPTVLITPSPTVMVTPAATPSAEISQNATISASINSLFFFTNKLFNSSIVPTKVNTFIVDGVETSQTAWKLDLNSVIKSKVELAKLVSLLEVQQKFKNNGMSDGPDGEYTNYESSLLKCVLFSMNTNKSLVCIGK